MASSSRWWTRCCREPGRPARGQEGRWAKPSVLWTQPVSGDPAPLLGLCSGHNKDQRAGRSRDSEPVHLQHPVTHAARRGSGASRGSCPRFPWGCACTHRGRGAGGRSWQPRHRLPSERARCWQGGCGKPSDSTTKLQPPLAGPPSGPVDDPAHRATGQREPNGRGVARSFRRVAESLL